MVRLNMSLEAVVAQMNNATLGMNYLVLPLTARYQNRNGFLAEAGVQPALLLSAKDKSSTNTGDVKDNFNSFDMGLVIGVGYRLLKSKISFGVRFVRVLLILIKSRGLTRQRTGTRMLLSDCFIIISRTVLGRYLKIRKLFYLILCN